MVKILWCLMNYFQYHYHWPKTLLAYHEPAFKEIRLKMQPQSIEQNYVGDGSTFTWEIRCSQSLLERKPLYKKTLTWEEMTRVSPNMGESLNQNKCLRAKWIPSMLIYISIFHKLAKQQPIDKTLITFKIFIYKTKRSLHRTYQSS